MSYTEAQVIGRISTVLFDASSAVWGTAVIRQGIDAALVEIAVEGKPYIVLATVTTSAGTKSVDISTVSGLLHGNSEQSFETVEFRVDKSPMRKRNFEIKGGRLAMEIDFLPDASEDVRLYVRKVHVLSGSTNSMDPVQEQLLIELAAARLAISKAVDYIGEITDGINPDQKMGVWGERKLAGVLQRLRGLKETEWNIQWPRGA